MKKLNSALITSSALLLSVTGILLAAPRASVQSGPWSVGATWGGTAPTGADDVTIAHIVTLDIPGAQAKTLVIQSGAELTFSTFTSTSLEMVDGDLTVNSGGKLTLGTEALPVAPLVTTTLTLSKPSGGTVRALRINNGGFFSAHGAAKTPYLLALQDAAAASVVVPAAGAANWSIGDRIVMGKTRRNSAEETESRIIASTSVTGSENTLTWSGNLSYPHTADVPFLIGNLTRNVVIRSSGTTASGAGADTAVIATFSPTPEHFKASAVLFQDLGNENDGAGIQIATADTIFISSCAFSGGHSSVRSDYPNANIIQDTVFYGWEQTAVFMNLTSANNPFRGIELRRNAFLGTAGAINLQNTANILIEGNYFIGSDVFAGSDRSFISSNTVVGSLDTAFYVFGNETVLTGNRFLRGMGYGALVDTGEGWVFSNIFTDNENGVWLRTTDTVFGGNRIYGNAGNGIFGEFGVQRTTLLEDWIGYDLDGNAAANQDAGSCGGICFPDNGSFILKNVRMHPTNTVNRNDLDAAGNYVLSFKHDQSPGAVRLWGSYSLAGRTLTLDNAQALYPSSASPVRDMNAADSTLIVNSTSDDFAVTQLISVEFMRDNLWHVRGSAAGDEVTLPPAGGTVDFPAVNPQVNLTLSSNSRKYGDLLLFYLSAASGDAGAQKSLLFGQAAASFNGGKSRLAADAASAVTLRGTPGTPVLVDRLFVTDPHYSFISSGTFTAENVAFSRLDADGLQLSGLSGVQLASATFSAGTAGGAYVTARNLQSTAPLPNLAFNAGPAQNIRVSGTDAGLNWTLSNWSGALGGQAFETDPNRRIRWLDGTPPAAQPLSAGADPSTTGRVLLSWTAPGNNGNALDLAPGSFRVFHSSNSADRDTAAPSQAQLVISTVAAPGSLHASTVSNLLLGTTYYFRFWTQDETPNASAPTDAQSLPGHPDPAAPGVSAAALPNQINVSWGPPSNVPPAYLAGYSLSVSTGNIAGPYSPLNPSLGPSETGFIHAGLAPETEYFYRLTASDTGGKTSPAGAASALTPDLTPPDPVGDLAAVPGVNPGEVLLTWSAPPDNGGLKNLPLGSRYYVQHAADAGISWSTASAQVSLATGPVTMGSPQSLVLENLPAGLRYFRLWTRDNGNNISLASVITSTAVRENAPSLSLLPFGAAAAPASSRQRTVDLAFSKTMNATTVETGFTLTRVKDRLGNAVAENVPGSFSWDGTGAVMTFTPGAALAGNSVYELRLAATAADPQGNSLAAPFANTFRTLMDPSEENLWENTPGGPRVLIPAGALAQESGLNSADGDGPLARSAAQKLVDNAGDPLRRPLPASAVDLTVADAFGAPLSGLFSAPVTVTLSYPDVDGDGTVDGTFPPVKAKTLSVHWLNEKTGAWVRLPTSRVDAGNHRVSAETTHFTVFALAGRADAELADAHPFPNPADASLPGAVMTFTGLGQVSTVKIHTREGRLVRVLRTDDGSGAVDWDLKNDAGEPVAAGLYLYEITSGPNKTTGKAAVVR